LSSRSSALVERHHGKPCFRSHRSTCTWYIPHGGVVVCRRCRRSVLCEETDGAVEMNVTWQPGRSRSIGEHPEAFHGLSAERRLSQRKSSILEESQNDINTPFRRPQFQSSSQQHSDTHSHIHSSLFKHSSHLSKNQPTNTFQQSKWFPSSL
jgi:hypothetical protein